MLFEIKRAIRNFLVYWKVYIIILAPLALLPLIFVFNRSESNGGYVIALMSIYWIFEVLPLPITVRFVTHEATAIESVVALLKSHLETSLIPMVLFPLLGIVKSKDLAKFYIQDTTLVFLSGLMIAIVMENVNLHKRIGTGILLKVGASPIRVLAGIMLPTWFLSMFISNTAATSMMVSASKAVVKQLSIGLKKAHDRKLKQEQRFETNAVSNEAFEFGEQTDDLGVPNPVFVTKSTKEACSSEESDVDADSSHAKNKTNEDREPNGKISCSLDDAINKNIGSFIEIDVSEDMDDFDTSSLCPEDQKRIERISQMLALSIAYSANIGGTGTLTGTPTNLLVADAVEKVFRENGLENPITFATWFFFSIPLSVICLVLLFIWMQLFYLRCSCCKRNKGLEEGEAAIKKVMREEYNKLGPVSFGEVVTSLLLAVMIILWLTRDPGFIDGYASLFRKGYVSDSTPSIFIVILLFIFPIEKPDWPLWRENKKSKPKIKRALLTWQEVCERLPWGPVILLGGGFAMAEGCRNSGLTELIGSNLTSLSALPPWLFAFIITLSISFITEVMSNTAVMALFLPILAAIAKDLSLNPLLLMLPAGMAASFAFMLPIATPPNAIVFSCANLKVFQMVKVGFVMNLLCVAMVTLALNTWGYPMFNLSQPPWVNATAVSN